MDIKSERRHLWYVETVKDMPDCEKSRIININTFLQHSKNNFLMFLQIHRDYV